MEQNNDPMMANEVHQITTFADDTPVVSGAKLMPASSSPWKSFAEENRNHGILDVLSRPVLLTNSSSLWSTAKNRNEPPTESLANSVFSFPSAILNRSQNIVKKLEGFTYFRANVKVRVMVNAQAFSQGKLWIWFSPYELASGTQFAADNLACKTGYPGVELDVASGQPAEFTIPYCAPMSHYCLTSGEGTMGDLFLTVLSPLTISDASLSVFAWFEDIDLQLPTGVPMGDPPATRYAIAPRQNVLFEVPTASPAAPGKVTSTFWGSKTLVCDGVDKAIATESFAIFPTPFNTPVSCIMVPVGTVFKATTVQHPNAPAEYNIVITTLQGYTGVLGTDMSQSGPDSNISMTMIQGANSIMAYEDGHEYVTPYYLFLNYKSDAAYSSTACSIPGILQCPVDQYVLTTDFFVVVGYRIDFYGPNTKVSYKVNNGEALVEINSASHQLATFATYSTLDDCYVSAIFKTDITKTGYFAFSQADSKDEDEWYKNYPHAQISESEHQAMSSLVTSSLGKVIAASTPMLAPLKTPLSWLSRLGTAVAAGYSKPVDVEKPRCIIMCQQKDLHMGRVLIILSILVSYPIIVSLWSLISSLHLLTNLIFLTSARNLVFSVLTLGVLLQLVVFTPCLLVPVFVILVKQVMSLHCSLLQPQSSDFGMVHFDIESQLQRQVFIQGDFESHFTREQCQHLQFIMQTMRTLGFLICHLHQKLTLKSLMSLQNHG